MTETNPMSVSYKCVLFVNLTNTGTMDWVVDVLVLFSADFFRVINVN
jgi:hypothetical protein